MHTDKCFIGDENHSNWLACYELLFSSLMNLIPTHERFPFNLRYILPHELDKFSIIDTDEVLNVIHSAAYFKLLAYVYNIRSQSFNILFLLSDPSLIRSEVLP
jgi:hypothetical protein